MLSIVGLMSFHVERKVIATAERPGTKFTLERLLTRVLAVVPCQLVRSGELPLAALPRALVRLLPRVSPLVGLEVRTLRVDLVAVGEITLMDFSLLQAVVVVTCRTEDLLFVVLNVNVISG